MKLGGTPVYQVRYRRVRPYLRQQIEGDSLRRVVTLHMHSKVLSVPLSIIPRSANAAATKMTSGRRVFIFTLPHFARCSAIACSMSFAEYGSAGFRVS